MKYVISFLLSTIIIFSCYSTEPENPNYDNVILVNKIDSTLWNIDSYSINTINYRENTLEINVNYSGGCEKHEFTFLITKGFDKSLPPQTEAFLSHNANGDGCEAYISEKLFFNLKELRDYYLETYGKVEPITIMLENYGKVEITLK